MSEPDSIPLPIPQPRRINRQIEQRDVIPQRVILDGRNDVQLAGLLETGLAQAIAFCC